MWEENIMKKIELLLFVVTGLMIMTFCAPGWAALSNLQESVITDSEEPFSRRIYSYDFDVTPNGTIHAVYAMPIPGQSRTNIIYATKEIGGSWPTIANRIVLEESGQLESISTYVLYDKNTGTVHICYIVQRTFIDNGGITHASGLVYQTIKNGVVSAKVNVSSGSFHTRMQLDQDGKIIFVREYEDFLNPDGTIRPLPYPKALRMHLPVKGATNQWTDKVLQLPSAEDYRLAGFVYDQAHGRYHIIYGDKNAVYLRNTYPTVNPPVTPDKHPVYFPPGSGHKLWHTYSTNLNNWTTSLVDGSGNISENEFWTDMIVDGNGVPYVASYRYATDAQGVQEGTSNILAKLKNDGTWQVQTVEGKNSGASPARAGMGSKLAIDPAGRFHGVWDNSPDKPIDAEGQGGNVMYRFSPDGENWALRQAILPYSAEGNCRMKIYNNKLLLMVLGDYRDARLIFAEFQMPAATDALFEVSTEKMFYAPGEAINLHAFIQGYGTGDYYILAVGPFNVNPSTGSIELIATTQYLYLGPDFAWHTTTSSLSPLQPILSNFPLFELNIDFFSVIARNTFPFINPARYALYSVVSRPGSPLLSFDFLTPVSVYVLHLCDQNQCGEL
jgi:hypothetical protein